MVIQKFGGTSVRDDKWMDKVLDIAAGQIDQSPVLISSAMAKVTDALVSIAGNAEAGKQDETDNVLNWLREHHYTVAGNFLAGANLDKCRGELDFLFEELQSIIKGLLLLRECSVRSYDMILSFGERLSTLILYYRALERGMDAEFLDSRDFIKTDNTFTNAYVIEELTNRLIKEKVKPAPGKLLIAQGFIASTEDGITTTLGRGGSDYTAAIIGAALSVEEIQIWTDVNGIMTSDPRVVKKATSIGKITYQEAAELAYFGAKVIHPATIQPAIAQGIPVVVKNTGEPEFKGTYILPAAEGLGPKAIAFKRNVTVVTISSTRMILAYGFLRKIFEVFEKYKTSVDLIATSEVSVSVTLDKADSVEKIKADLESFGTISIEKGQSIISLVGQDLWKNSEIISRVFNCLKAVPVRMISMGSSDTNLSFVTNGDSLEEAVMELHKVFFE